MYRKNRTKKLAASIAASLLFSLMAPYASADVAKSDDLPKAAPVYYALSETPLESQAKEWIGSLIEDGGKTSPFSGWRNATLETSPLGPGTHSWIVLVKKKAETLGYLIIHAKEEGGFQLGEYGTGEWPLFNEHSLKLTGIQLQPAAKSRSERVYIHPLLNAWRITDGSNVHYMDAVTGEMLPADEEGWTKQSQKAEDGLAGDRAGTGDTHGKLAASLVVPSFNPYETLPWLTRKPLNLDGPDKLAAILNGLTKEQKLRYTTLSFENKYRAVWSVVGFNRWSDDQLYVALDSDEEGTDRRYIPAEWLLAMGDFYK
ncbi:hypothetical protein ACX93W_06690 [Paenibacillus sp. CAU 1782]